LERRDPLLPDIVTRRPRHQNPPRRQSRRARMVRPLTTLSPLLRGALREARAARPPAATRSSPGACTPAPRQDRPSETPSCRPAL
jgi:hypothetical protein